MHRGQRGHDAEQLRPVRVREQLQRLRDAAARDIAQKYPERNQGRQRAGAASAARVLLHGPDRGEHRADLQEPPADVQAAGHAVQSAG